MEQFALEKYLENQSRKVVTREGRTVRIVCWDLKCNTPIIVAIQWNQEREDCYCYNTAGRCANNVGELDLFFADEEEELTEFDYAVLSIISDHNRHTDSIEAFAKRSSKKLLNLARKEIKGILTTDAYNQGREDALKDLPKWKKANVFVSNQFGLATRDDDLIITCNGYQIKLSDLKTLPKEE